MTGPAHPERRVHTRVRAVFAEACALLAPMLMGGEVSGYALAHIVRDRYPELSEEEVHVLITAAARLRQDPRLQAILRGSGA